MLSRADRLEGLVTKKELEILEADGESELDPVPALMLAETSVPLLGRGPAEEVRATLLLKAEAADELAS